MSQRDPALVAALAPVRAALLAAARHDATRVWERAHATAERALADAAQEAARIRAQAIEQGAADAAGTLAAERAQARRAARATVLAAQREAYEAIRAQARAAVRARPDEPGYPAIRSRLVRDVRRLLGPEAAVRDGTGGGVVGEDGRRRVDYSLAGFADRAVDAVLADLEQP